ncbi:3-deoxy-D-manno-octulosonic acid kinase [Oceanospirillum beijerinckii]|uniref:3-deoxy-D-manno-octulosonic acid kinase n=1 Tax=Oceanospirillum beijerinckii TaxID=64976 RepID=UPI0003F63EB4|nr:3-deoxy-D-manno-octulosonic acid kinase [Oceanospirillum beijerinckii]MAC46109.1 3-deoxy-D-manno-octulosonic acid kinase [Oceanospirillum sp.]
MEIQLYSKNRHHILYDAQQIPQINEHWFEQTWWQDKGQISEPSGGRGQAIFIQPRGDFCTTVATVPELVLRHYRRGGLIARLIKDRYLFTGLENSRPWQEFKLTCTLFEQGLPVPRPIAAHIQQQGLFYQADLITERLPNSQPFANYLSPGKHDKDADLTVVWQNVGHTLACFHRFGLNHSDLNANNILIGTTGQVWVIDFDRCQLDDPKQTQWQQNNIQRLQRSILKLIRQEQLSGQLLTLWQQLYQSYHLLLSKTESD